MRAELAIMTCPREPVYVHGLLGQLFERTDVTDVRVRVVADCCESDGAFLGPWRDDERIEKEFLLLPTSEPMGHPARILRTFKRCLAPLGRAVDGPLVVMQDDARVAHHWLDKALEAMGRARELTPMPGSFFLTLWSTIARHMPGEVNFVLPDNFFGTVAVLLPRALPLRVHEFMCHVDPNTPDDVALKAYAKATGSRIYDVHPSLVQHVGAASTHGYKGTVITSPSYRDGEP